MWVSIAQGVDDQCVNIHLPSGKSCEADIIAKWIE
jgi:hypothetical protein